MAVSSNDIRRCRTSSSPFRATTPTSRIRAAWSVRSQAALFRRTRLTNPIQSNCPKQQSYRQSNRHLYRSGFGRKDLQSRYRDTDRALAQTDYTQRATQASSSSTLYELQHEDVFGKWGVLARADAIRLFHWHLFTHDFAPHYRSSDDQSAYRTRGGIGTRQIGLFRASAYYGYQGSNDQIAGPAGGLIYGGSLSYLSDGGSDFDGEDRRNNQSSIADWRHPFLPLTCSIRRRLTIATE